MLRNRSGPQVRLTVITGHESRAMKALVYRARQDLRYESISEASPCAGQVLVKVKYAGMCHTDFHEDANGPIFVSSTPHARTGRSVPLVLGHEFSAQIVQTGSDVTERKTGDRVAINAVDGCGACPYCIRGQGALCSSAAYIGFNLDGGFAEFAAVPATCCHVLPARLPYRDAVLVEPLSVAIVGGGTLGLCMLQAVWAAERVTYS